MYNLLTLVNVRDHVDYNSLAYLLSCVILQSENKTLCMHLYFIDSNLISEIPVIHVAF